ncbi:MAG TPA: hypothetical protein VFD01_07415 [Candidatus Dormibacteraeota bacterium]|jgi:rubrerythrin|nr:hypothetical protein [Candidatus Dormibacteraeota bacterium]
MQNRCGSCGGVVEGKGWLCSACCELWEAAIEAHDCPVCRADRAEARVIERYRERTAD